MYLETVVIRRRITTLRALLNKWSVVSLYLNCNKCLIACCSLYSRYSKFDEMYALKVGLLWDSISYKFLTKLSKDRVVINKDHLAVAKNHCQEACCHCQKPFCCR